MKLKKLLPLLGIVANLTPAFAEIKSAPTELKNAFIEIYPKWMKYLTEHPNYRYDGEVALISTNNRPVINFMDYEVFYDNRSPSFDHMSLDVKFGKTILDKVDLQEQGFSSEAIAAGSGELENYSTINQTLTTQTMSLSVVDTTSTTTTSGWEENTSLGVDVKVAVKVPIVGGVDTTYKVNQSFAYNGSTSNATQHSETKTFTSPSQNIIVPGKCRATVQTLLRKTNTRGTFTFQTLSTGNPSMNVLWWLPPDYERRSEMTFDLFAAFYFFPIANVDYNNNVSGYNYPEIALRSTADFSGVSGTDLYVEVRMADLTPGSCPSIRSRKIEIILPKNQEMLKTNFIAKNDYANAVTDKNGLSSITYTYSYGAVESKEVSPAVAGSGVRFW